MRKLLFILTSTWFWASPTAQAEALLMEEKDLDSNFLLNDERYSDSQTFCDYTSTQFDPVTLDYTTVCLGLNVSQNGVADSFGASASWYSELHDWSDTSAQTTWGKDDDLGTDLEKHYLEVYETAQLENGFNQKNWMLMQNAEIQKTSIKEMLGKAFSGQDVQQLISDDPTRDMKSLMRDVTQMGSTGSKDNFGVPKLPSLNNPAPVMKGRGGRR